MPESDSYDTSNSTHHDKGVTVYQELCERFGEGAPQARLDPTRRVAALLGDPQRSYPIIHVAGTNGKTSTCRIIERILRGYGLSTGMFTSPHVTRFNERFAINGEPISDDALAENWADIRPYVDMVDAELLEAGEPRLTFFETSTILSFACFADAPVDVAVIEVGLGGEWDSTNIADGQVAVFTPISLDHIDRLGSTIAEIARTKSGIIKPSQTVVSACQPRDVAKELLRAAKFTEASMKVCASDFELVQSLPAVGGQILTVRGIAATYDDVFLSLFGEYQAENAAVAIAAVEVFFGSRALNHDIIREACSAVQSPGRLDVIARHPSVIVDAAHNPAAAQALSEAFSTFFTAAEVAIVIGVLDDKDAGGIVAPLDGLATQWYVTQSSSDRARDCKELAEIVAGVTDADIHVCETVEDAIERAREWALHTPGRAVLVTGSISLVADVMGLAVRNSWRDS